MSINPLLHKLGLSDNDRVVIFHADDISMCHASLAAYQALVEVGLISSAAAMVPCPWFPATAAFCRSRPALDVGVHLTLTSEWEAYRWGPVSTRDVDSGLLDKAGLFPQRCSLVQTNANLDAVRRELQAQIEYTLAAGIDATHLDSHMGCLFHPRLLPAYLEMAQTYRLPALLLRPEALEQYSGGFLDAATFRPFFDILHQMEAEGFPLLDAIEMMPLNQPEHRLDEAKRRLDRLPVGISYFIIHPCQDTPEIRSLAPDWRCRVADYELFCSESWRETIVASGVKVIDWRELRDLLRTA